MQHPWEFHFWDGYGNPHSSLDVDDIIKWCDSHMITQNMITGKDSRYVWFGNQVMEVVDEFKGIRHQRDVTLANTWWVCFEGETIWTIHHSHWAKSGQPKPQGVTDKGHTSEQVLDLVWEYMNELASTSNEEK